ncbi:NAD(P)-dependent oxidoreductase [Brachybacterium sacelli]|uniref:3-hydroxyisobutyrate dehydrogenase-like beta-hydroxyacid dehydrogenase n=1 Tax=Brachybacterium sacelli TaxID=173364 RepID=A0ABS4WWN8_9MICO|nr:NAD(P)-binding domain-containing protein [Brachybacterium sacelli]MBP2380616.1 3-hydroxyisobutyrate dehydrogenase-like beta-hydroxyacid dehydrogenase [Brachybacterium sacelli]
MTTATVLGLGQMGHALAAALTRSHHPTTVWNRTSGKAHDLDVTVASTPAEAVSASPLVIVCLPDYEVVRTVLDPLPLSGSTVVNVSGGSPEQAREIDAWAAEKGIDYIDGVIVATPEVIGSPAAALYYSGRRDAYETHRSTLAAFGENAIHLGDDVGMASAFDASLQSMLWTSMSGVVHMFALASAENISAQDIAGSAKTMLALFPDMIDLLAEQVDAGRFPADGASIAATAAVLDHILSTLHSNGLDDGVLRAVRADLHQAIEAGHGSEGFGRLSTLAAR